MNQRASKQVNHSASNKLQQGWPYEDETVSRLRPLARRRLRTSRPFLVLMRTRKPCVRLRRLLLGWNVRFPFMIAVPCIERTSGEKTQY